MAILPVYPDVVGRAGLSPPAAHGMQNIMLRRRAGTDAPYLHHRQHRDAPPFFMLTRMDECKSAIP